MDLSPAARRLLEWQSAAEALLLVVEHGGPTMFARIGVMRALNRSHVRVFDPSRKSITWARDSSRGVSVLIYVDTSNQVRDPDHLEVLANADAAETWIEETDPEGIAFEYEALPDLGDLLGQPASGYRSDAPVISGRHRRRWTRAASD